MSAACARRHHADPLTWFASFLVFLPFFVPNSSPAHADIGSNVVDWPLEAQRGLADGHEICGHT